MQTMSVGIHAKNSSAMKLIQNLICKLRGRKKHMQLEKKNAIERTGKEITVLMESVMEKILIRDPLIQEKHHFAKEYREFLGIEAQEKIENSILQ